MKKQFLPESAIQSWAHNGTVFARGQELKKQNLVHVKKVNQENHVIYFAVEDNQYQNLETSLSFYPNGVAKKYHCSCDFFKKYTGACKHVVASMVYLNTINLNDLADNPDHQNQLNEEKLISSENNGDKLQPASKAKPRQSEAMAGIKKAIKANSHNGLLHLNSEPLNFEFVVNISQNSIGTQSELYMKVGLDHMYVVKNIPYVAQQLYDGNDYEFGKNFIYQSDRYRITSEDREVLKKIINLSQLQQSLLTYGNGINYTNKKEFEIPLQSLSQFISLVEKTDGGFIRFGTPPLHLSTIDDLEAIEYYNHEKLELELKLEKTASNYQLCLSDYKPSVESISFIQEANLIEVNHHLYQFDERHIQVAKYIVDLFDHYDFNSLIIYSHEIMDFMNNIYPLLSEIFQFEIQEDIKRLMVFNDLEAVLYLDYQANELKILPLFVYGQEEFNPMDESESNSIQQRIVVRDKLKEQLKLKFLFENLPRNHIDSHQIVINDIEKIGNFIIGKYELIMEEFKVFVSDNVQNLFYTSNSNRAIYIDKAKNSNLLEVSFNLEDISDHELQEIVSKLRNENVNFYRRDNGQLINLKDDSIQKINQIAQELGVEAKDIQQEMELPTYRGLSIIDHEEVVQGKEFNQMAQALLEPKTLTIQTPHNLKAKLRPYQEEGFKWLYSLDAYQFGGILADDMGLGKTIQTIAFILSKLNQNFGYYLIICPSSVLYNWQSEFNKFAPDVKTIIISGNQNERKNLVGKAMNEKIPVWLTSYPLIQRDIELYEDTPFETVILDESQNVKNENAKTSIAVKRISSTNKFALSGTPIENNLNELWSIFSIIQPGLFKNKRSYHKLSPHEISKRIKPFILRRLKGQVLEDLPEKTETVEYVELSAEQKRLYQTQRQIILSEIDEYIAQEDFQSNKFKVLAGMTRLRQICCDPRLLDAQMTQNDSAKLIRLQEYLDTALANGKRVVLFSQFTQMLSLIKDKLDKQNISYHYLDGQTKKDERLELTTRFNQGEKALFLISLKAGGTGLNLTGGDTVVLYDSWWNPAIEDQAADRVHRFGQKNPVQVVRFIAKGTIEEKISDLQDKKRELIDSVVEANESKKINQLSREEILDLLNYKVE